MKINNQNNNLYIANGLITSIIISTCCIVSIIIISYLFISSDRNYDNGGVGDTNEKKGHSSITGDTSKGENSDMKNSSTMGGSIDTSTKPLDGTNNIKALLENIENNSQEQLHIWQQRNTDPTFLPQMIMPRYFKTFNGDNYSMQK